MSGNGSYDLMNTMMSGASAAKDRFSRHLNLEDGKLLETHDGEQTVKNLRVRASGSVELGCTKISAAAMKHIVAEYISATK